MALIHGYVKDLDLRLPLLKQIRFRDPRTGDVHDGWLIAVRELTLAQRAILYEDCRNRFQQSNSSLGNFPSEDEFWNEVLTQNGIPIRAERVDVAYDMMSLNVYEGALKVETVKCPRCGGQAEYSAGSRRAFLRCRVCGYGALVGPVGDAMASL